jgi:hypothetical protein
MMCALMLALHTVVAVYAANGISCNKISTKLAWAAAHPPNSYLDYSF